MTGLANAIAAIDPIRLVEEYEDFRLQAPRRSSTSRQYFVGHNGTTAKPEASNRKEELTAIALRNLGRYWPLPTGGWFRLLDYQVPLKARQDDVAIGKIDLLGVTDDDRLMIVELKVRPNNGRVRGDSPMTALMEGLRYAAAVEADLDAIATEAQLRFGNRLVRKPPVIALLAPLGWWQGWTGSSATGEWETPFKCLISSVSKHLGVTFQFLALEDITVDWGADLHAPRYPTPPRLFGITPGQSSDGRALVLPRVEEDVTAAYERTVSASLWNWAAAHHAGDLDGGGRRGRSPVLRRDKADFNVLTPGDERLRPAIQSAIPLKQRHRHFASLRSSQALAQSVFASIREAGRLDVLESIHADCGRPAFMPTRQNWKLNLEHDVQTLGEPRPTSVDVLLSAPQYRVAVECKFTETEFGTCSRPRLRPEDPGYQNQCCDGTYRLQAGRMVRCALTGIGVRYWDYLPSLFAWPSDRDHEPCPMAATYQLARNALAVLVDSSGTVDRAGGHMLVVYDKNNPAFRAGGTMNDQWEQALAACLIPGLMRRVSWQRLLVAMATAPELAALASVVSEKYSLN